MGIRRFFIVITCFLGCLPSLTLRAQTEFAQWTESVNNTSGTAIFSTNPHMPDLTWSVSGDVNDVVVDNSETFNGTNFFETLYGQADSESNLNIRCDVNTGLAGAPIDKQVTLTINFNSHTPTKDWAFCALDLDVDQLKVEALDTAGNPVSLAVINTWFRETFDADPGLGGNVAPTWDPSAGYIVGSSDGDGLYDNLIQSISEDEAGAAWFAPNVPLSALILTFENKYDHPTTGPSFHLYLATKATQPPDSDGDGVFDYQDLDDDNDGIGASEEGCVTLISHPNQDFAVGDNHVYTAASNDGGDAINLSNWPTDISAGNLQTDTIANWTATTNRTIGLAYLYTNSDLSLQVIPNHAAANGGVFDANSTSFASGTTGNALGIRPGDQDTDDDFSIRVLIDFNSPVHGVAFEMIDIFDQGLATTGDSKTGFEIWVDGVLLVYTDTLEPFTNGTTGTRTLHGADGTDVNYTLGNAQELAFGFYNHRGISQVEIIYSVDGPPTSTGDSESWGFDNLTYLSLDCADSDGDGIADSFDLDADGDGIPDIVEAGGIDHYKDGRLDYPTPGDPRSMVDADGDGWDDRYDTEGGTVTSGTNLPARDTDGDGLADYKDVDSDQDGIPDLLEARGVDSDGNGRVDMATDVDGDGLADIYDEHASDGPAGAGSDGTALLATTVDSNGDGLLNAAESIVDGSDNDADADDDGAARYVDLDSDQDGIPDLVEARGIDSDGNGRVDNVTDSDGDGLIDIYDEDASDGPSGTGTDGTALVKTSADLDTNGLLGPGETWLDGIGASLDTDADGVVDAEDADSDNDNVPDLLEVGGINSSGNGMADANTDADEDGLVDVYDQDASDGPGGTGTNGTALVETSIDANGDGRVNHAESLLAGNSNIIDFDGDGIPNHLDLDSDNDGIPDVLENGGVDTNGDGIADGFTDADGDGFSDIQDGSDNDPDTDNDVAFNASANNPLVQSDSDTDGNGIVNGTEGYAKGDLEGDGHLNAMDLDSDNDGILDIVELLGAGADLNHDGLVDQYNPGTGSFIGGADSEGDGYANAYDTDDDNDGAASGGGVAMLLSGSDTDSDGLPDSYTSADFDIDLLPSFLDVDADNDGILDNMEAQATGQVGTQTYFGLVSTVDANGVPTIYGSYTNYDTDNTTVLSATYGILPYDHDGDGTPDFLDTDSDNDGDPDVDEAWDSAFDGDGVADINCSTDNDRDGLRSCFDANDSDPTIHINANDPPDDNAFEAVMNGGSTPASSFVSLDGSSVLFYDVFPNNGGDAGDIQPDWRDNSCVVAAGLEYPITGTDAIFSGGVHVLNPTANSGAIRTSDYCEGLLEASWTYYFDPLNPGKVLFAIAHGTNTTQIDYVELRRDVSAARNATNVGEGDGYFVMARDFYVRTVNNAPLTGPVNVRFYYDPADSLATDAAAEAFASSVNRLKSTPVWFKTDAQFSNGQINAANGLSQLSGYIVLTPAAYGEEAGKHYVQFDGLSSFSGVGMGVGVEGSLPVDWLDFRVNWEGEKARLLWTTTNEENTDYFEITRSENGTNFQDLGTKKAANSPGIHQYEFVDPGAQDLSQPTVYYRLRQVDLDGKSRYSSVVELNLAEEGFMAIYPSPAESGEELIVQLAAGNAQVAELRITNKLGQTLYRERLLLEEPVKKKIDTDGWPGGIYQVQLQTEGTSFSQKVLVR
jgi:hypothetical protein